MANFNKIILLGNLVRKPEIRVTDNSTVIARSAIAVNRKYKDKDETMFIDIVIFGKLAQIIEQYADKGTQILIEGRLSQNRWDDNGQARSKHEIVVDSFQLVGNKKLQSGDYINEDKSSFSTDDDLPF